MEQDRQHVAVEQQPDLGDRLKLIGAAIVFGALLLFFFQNLQEAEINFLWFEWRTDMIWALLASALLGAGGALLIAMLRRRRVRPPAERR